MVLQYFCYIGNHYHGKEAEKLKSYKVCKDCMDLYEDEANKESKKFFESIPDKNKKTEIINRLEVFSNYIELTKSFELDYLPSQLADLDKKHSSQLGHLNIQVKELVIKPKEYETTLTDPTLPDELRPKIFHDVTIIPKAIEIVKTTGGLKYDKYLWKIEEKTKNI